MKKGVMKVKTAIIAALLIVLPALVGAVDITTKGKSMSTDKETADSLLAVADAEFKDSRYQEARDRYQTAIESAHNEFNRSVETEATAQVARMYLITGEKEMGREWLIKAEGLAVDSDPMGWSRFLGVRGRFEWKDGDSKAARKTFEDMYDYCSGNLIWSRAVDAAHMIAIVSDDPAEQIEWGKRGIEAAEKTDNESWLGPLWNNMAGTYYDLKEFDSALTCYLKAREYHWRFSGETGKLFADYHVGMTYRLLGEFDEAASWLRPVLAWAERLGNHSAAGQAAEDLGEVSLAKGQRDDGIALLQRARDEYRKAGFDKSWPEVWQHVNKRLSDLGQK
jgi:tetratricopeptide (TPR) repeat protein